MLLRLLLLRWRTDPKVDPGLVLSDIKTNTTCREVWSMEYLRSREYGVHITTTARPLGRGFGAWRRPVKYSVQYDFFFFFFCFPSDRKVINVKLAARACFPAASRGCRQAC